MTSYPIAMDLLALMRGCEDKSTRLATPFAGPNVRGGIGAFAETPAAWSPIALLVNQPVAIAGFRPRMSDVVGPPPRGAPV